VPVYLFFFFSPLYILRASSATPPFHTHPFSVNETSMESLNMLWFGFRMKSDTNIPSPPFFRRSPFRAKSCLSSLPPSKKFILDRVFEPLLFLVGLPLLDKGSQFPLLFLRLVDHLPSLSLLDNSLASASQASITLLPRSLFWLTIPFLQIVMLSPPMVPLDIRLGHVILPLTIFV